MKKKWDSWMPHQNKSDIWRPLPRQELLLKSALLPHKKAEDAWTEWKKITHIEHIHISERRLLPLVSKNLEPALNTEELLPHLRSIRKKGWYQNNIFHFHLAKLLKEFSSRSIGTILLKGMALSLFYYKDLGIRPMEDFDILVKPRDCRNAINLLLNHGWTLKHEFQSPRDEYFFAYKSSLHFEHRSGAHCDLNWQLFHMVSQGDGDKYFWDHATPVSVLGSGTLILKAEDQLFHLCQHATKDGDTPSARWVADAMIVLHEARDTLDWDRFLKMTGDYRHTLFIKNMLAYLRDTFQAYIPDTVWKNLENAEISRTEKVYYLTMRRHGEMSRHFFNFTWFLHTAIFRKKPGRPWNLGPKAILKYFQIYLDAKYIWQIPSLLFSKTFTRISRTLSAKNRA